MEKRDSVKPISLVELTALNDEMAALVRAGIPLEQGLVAVGHDFPGRVGEVALRLGERLQAGESLGRILTDDSSSFPPVWRATVAAGLRSGRLASVLESLATTGRRIGEMRRTITAALVYPTMVVILAYAVFVFLVAYLAPQLADAFDDLTGTVDPVVRWLAWVGVHTAWWAFWPPAAVGALLLVEWWQARRATLAAQGPMRGTLGRLLPSVREAQREAQLASFLEVLSLLLREQTPMPEALLLAAQSSGDDSVRRSALELAAQLQRGQSPSGEQVRTLKIPPLLGFMLASGSDRSVLSDVLERTARIYRERSSLRAARAAMLLPLLVTLVVGGTVTLLLGVGTLLPVWRLMLQLGT